MRRHRLLLLPACIAALALAPGGSAGAASTQVCNPVPKYPGEGYFTTLTVKGVRCLTGKNLAVEYYRCRIRAGGIKGRCTRRINNFRCTERRNTIPTEINARVTCRRATQTVVHTYQQNT